MKHAFQRLHFPDLNGDSSNEALHLAYETISRPPRTSFAYSASNAAFKLLNSTIASFSLADSELDQFDDVKHRQR